MGVVVLTVAAAACDGNDGWGQPHSRAWRDRLIFRRSPSQDVGRGTNLRWDRVIYYSGC